MIGNAKPDDVEYRRMFVFQSYSTETRSKLNNIKADNIRQDVRVFSGYLVIFSGPP